MIIVNSCGFINPAKEESINTLISFRHQYPDKKIILAGCLAQRYGKELVSSLTEADGIFGNKALHEIAEAADNFIKGLKKIHVPLRSGSIEKLISREKVLKKSSRVSLSFPGSIYVKIAEGCDNNCTYCAIPLIRGKLESRNFKDIIDEIKKVIGQGFFEINLIAQDLASYGNDHAGKNKQSLINLLEKISSLSGKIWIRLLYMHPDHFDPAVLEIMKSDKRIIPYFDIPFQHASENILRKMGRRGNFSSHLKIIESIRTAIPESVIRSTFLLGFPGEEKKDYLLVKKFLKEAMLDWAGFFSYSKEENTKAFRMGRPAENLALAKVTPRRVLALKEYQTEITEKKLARFEGKTLDILVEEEFPEADIALGRGYMNAPDVDGAVIIHINGAQNIKPSKVVKCKITKRNNIDLEAAVICR
jgi:ribosomal protein S12 methylthiotransferase